MPAQLTNRPPKAADITDQMVYAALDAFGTEGYRVSWSRIAEALSSFPEKVVLAKLRQMVKGNRLGADCTCGCHGSYHRIDMVPVS